MRVRDRYIGENYYEKQRNYGLKPKGKMKLRVKTRSSQEGSRRTE